MTTSIQFLSSMSKLLRIQDADEMTVQMITMDEEASVKMEKNMEEIVELAGWSRLEYERT